MKYKMAFSGAASPLGIKFPQKMYVSLTQLHEVNFATFSKIFFEVDHIRKFISISRNKILRQNPIKIVFSIEKYISDYM